MLFQSLARSYGALSAGAQPQSATDTIDKLCDRLLNGTQLDDRRAALLGLKGLSRDWKTEVGQRALPILLGVLQEDAPEDVEIGKAVVETLSLLCEVEEVDGKPAREDSGLRNSDVFLATPTPLHTLLSLLSTSHFYLRFFTLQLLGILLANRSNVVQGYVLTAPGGLGRIVETLDDSREIIRNESLLLLIALATANADIQKLLAFEGAFDKLFAIIRQEGGIDAGGIVVQDCLAAIGGLLRWNVSNQNYFRETSCIPLLAPLLLFPQPKALTPATLAAFAFQQWSEQKVINAGLVLSLVRMLVGGAGSGRAGNQKALLASGITRCLAELALASNAPAVLKSRSLNALSDIMRNSSPNQEAMTSLVLTPLIPPLAPPAPEHYPAEGENLGEDERASFDRASTGQGAVAPSESKWRRGTPTPAVVAAVQLAVNGDGTPGREGLRVRAAAVNLFESYVAGSHVTQLGILSTMSAPLPDDNANAEDASQPTPSAGSILLQGMRVVPSTSRNEQLDSYVPFFACLMFSHLLYNSDECKTAALKIYFNGDDVQPGGMGDEDDRISLVAILVGNLMMAQREQAQSQNAGLGPERVLQWSRVMVGYLIVLSAWMWESPVTVKEFLIEGSNLQVLIQPITQSSGVDSAVQGLCAFLLGIVYEYCREPGPITRETLHPILQSRVGPDQFVSRILRLREDDRFRSVLPNVLEMADDDDALDEPAEEDGLWFDFAFVEFLKTNYVAVQRAILLEPGSNESRRSFDASGDAAIANALRTQITTQLQELEDLRIQLTTMQRTRDEEQASFRHEIATLTQQVASLQRELEDARVSKAETDKEQEDLLVLLEDIYAKRKADKKRLRSAGFEVSEDEDDDEEVDATDVPSEPQAPPQRNGDNTVQPVPVAPIPAQQMQHSEPGAVKKPVYDSEAYNPSRYEPPPKTDNGYEPSQYAPRQAEHESEPETASATSPEPAIEMASEPALNAGPEDVEKEEEHLQQQQQQPPSQPSPPTRSHDVVAESVDRLFANSPSYDFDPFGSNKPTSRGGTSDLFSQSSYLPPSHQAFGSKRDDWNNPYEPQSSLRPLKPEPRDKVPFESGPNPFLTLSSSTSGFFGGSTSAHDDFISSLGSSTRSMNGGGGDDSGSVIDHGPGAENDTSPLSFL
ncbi:Vesicle-mediated ER to Golgi transport protein [Microbotryomycetes sp. JL201]|nr:Vesicle-mediated ER to Golgi transport protein [Microbotryomycetes sp. JL201]